MEAWPEALRTQAAKCTLGNLVPCAKVTLALTFQTLNPKLRSAGQAPAVFRRWARRTRALLAYCFHALTQRLDHRGRRALLDRGVDRLLAAGLVNFLQPAVPDPRIPA